MNIWVTGDFHGTLDMYKFNNNDFPEKEEHKEDILFQGGDFGLLFEDPMPQFNVRIIDNLSKKYPMLLVVPGNHENYKMIRSLPTCQKFKGKWYKLRDNILLAKRGEIYHIKGKKFLTLSGALSIDKHRRVLDVSYWEEELWTEKEKKRLKKNLDKVNWEVDYVISHTAPKRIIQKMLDNPRYRKMFITTEKVVDPTSEFFEEIEKDLKFEHWYFGHMHEDKKVEEKFTCVFMEIKHIAEI
jgi:hypothetical protein